MRYLQHHHEHVTLLATTIALVVGWVALGNSAARAETPPAIPFQNIADVGETIGTGQKVIMVFFTADWCGWCEKMKTTTFRDERVLALADRFTWAQVDTDLEPDVAATFGVRGLPALMWFNAAGERLASRSGYISPELMVDLLRGAAGQAATAGEARQRITAVRSRILAVNEAADAKELDAAVADVVELVAGDREVRRIARQTLREVGRNAWPTLIHQLADERLAIRAAAYDLLSEVTEHNEPFDPFAEPEVRAAQIQRWRDWFAALPAEAPAAADPAPDESVPADSAPLESDPAP